MLITILIALLLLVAVRFINAEYPIFRKARVLAVSLVVMLTVLFDVTSASAETASPSLQQGLANGNNEFAVQLYRQLVKDSKGNLFFSPYSVSSALGMTYVGARGNTAKEMKEALHFQFDQQQLGDAFRMYNKELASLTSRDGQKLSVANGLTLTGGNVSGEYKTILRDCFDAEMFSGGLDEINGWVARKTEGKIPAILDQLNANSVCVILNAIYFKSIWETQFRKSLTHEGSFMLSSTRQVKAQFMLQKDDFRLLEEEDLQAISIPYKGNDLSMVILLPRNPNGLASLEQKLDESTLSGWLERLDKQNFREVELYLPKFTLESGYDLIGPFSRMGMKDAFGMNADFTGMGWAKGDLWIGQIKHKAFVDVNEEGTEAAAVTAVEMVTKAMPYTPEFRADHPFIFLIRDNHKGTFLFMGRVTDPTVK
jgi:serpin B